MPESTLVAYVLVVSTLSQLVAALLALRLIRITERRLAWSLIASALILMAVRRIIPLYRLLAGEVSVPPDLLTELIGLVLSVIMAVGIARIAPLFMERKRVEAALTASEERFRRLAENASDVIYRMSLPDGRYEYMSPAVLDLFGYTPEEFYSSPQLIRQIIPPDWQGYFEKQWSRLLQGEMPAAYEYPLIHKSGAVRWVNQRNILIRDDLGRSAAIEGIVTDITERKRAENALRESEERFRSFVEKANDIVYTVSSDGVFTYVSPNWKEILGHEISEVLGQSFELFVHPDDLAACRAILNRTLVSGEKPSGFEYRVKHQNGSWQWHTSNASVIRDADDRIISFLGIARNITDRKQAETALRESEARLKEAQRVGRIGSWDWDAQTDTITWSEEYYRIYGFDPQLPPPGYEEHLKVYTPESAARLNAAVQRNMQTGEPYELDLELAHTEGPGRWITARSETKRDENGRIVGLRGTAQDITERKRVEEQLRRSERGLAEAQRIMQLGNWELDVVQGGLTWSDEIYRIFEIDPKKFGASYNAFLNAIHPEDRDRVNQAYTDSVKNKTPYDIVHRLQMPDGRIKYVNEKCETYYGNDGQPLRSVGTVHDITERRRAEEEIRRLNEELEQRVIGRTAQLVAANQELEAFAYSISHDLRAPLRHIDGFLDLLHKHATATLDEQSQHYMATISDAAKRMGTLIDDLLAFSRLGRHDVSKKQVDLADLVRDVIRELEPETQGRDIHWRVADLPQVVGDQVLLRLVLVDLISNALKFTRPRQSAEIDIGCAPGEDAETVIFVRDNGVGFDMKYVEKLFGVFQRLHRAEDFEGVGIGLANVRRIINRHGGRTWAEGEVDRGATFYFSLPPSVPG